MVKGIDISSIQGRINWSKVKAAGIEAAIIRIIRKRGNDECFEKNFTEARNAGIKVGVYAYSYALDTDSAIEEANRVLDALNGRVPDMPIWMDLEWENQGALGKKKVTAIAKAFMQQINEAGLQCGIYSNQSWHDRLIDWEALGNPDWWAARPGNTPVGAYVIHQYDFHGWVDGISKEVDLDYFYQEYWSRTMKYPKWIKNGDDWYYRIGKGINAHGFNDIKCKDGNTYRFYFDDKGKMQTGWQHIGDSWYFFHDSVGSGLEGAMYVSDHDGKQSIATFNG